MFIYLIYNQNICKLLTNFTFEVLIDTLFKKELLWINYPT